MVEGGGCYLIRNLKEDREVRLEKVLKMSLPGRGNGICEALRHGHT